MSYPNLSALLEAIVYVPIACSLSGGLDSSAVVALLSLHQGRPIQTYTLGFAGSEADAYNETALARSVAQQWGAEHHEVLKQFLKSQIPPTRLSLAALETLAVIAYKQPVTIPEIQDIRGVHASGVIKTLLDKKFVTTAGRKDVLGRPILYKTTKEFLVHFGLKDLNELPSMEEFEELIKNQAAAEEEIPEEV